MILPTLQEWAEELEGRAQIVKFNCNKNNKELGIAVSAAGGSRCSSWPCVLAATQAAPTLPRTAAPAAPLCGRQAQPARWPSCRLQHSSR